MSDVILTVLERPEAASRLLAGAHRLADLTKAQRVVVLGVRMPPLATIMPTEEILSKKDELRIRSEEQARTAALKRIYDLWAAQVEHLSTEWSDVEGVANEVVGEWGRRADHVVLSQPFGRGHYGTERDAIHGALFETDRPVLVIPEGRPSSFGQHVAIAWRDDPRTLKAVLSCLRWLDRAETVHLLAGVREGDPRPKVPDVLTEHGIVPQVHVLPIPRERVFGEVLLAKANEVGADLLVLGAYVRQPLARLLLGGVTRYMLANADLPLVMRH